MIWVNAADGQYELGTAEGNGQRPEGSFLRLLLTPGLSHRCHAFLRMMLRPIWLASILSTLAFRT